MSRPAGAAVLAVLLAAAGAKAAEPPRSTRDGVFTTAQADRGKLAYKRACVECHPYDWYRGEPMKSWEGGPLDGLYELIQNRMPPQNPGSLKRAEYADILAYILSINGQPAGSRELSGEPGALNRITYQGRNKP